MGNVRRSVKCKQYIAEVYASIRTRIMLGVLATIKCHDPGPRRAESVTMRSLASRAKGAEKRARTDAHGLCVYYADICRGDCQKRTQPPRRRASSLPSPSSFWRRRQRQRRHRAALLI